MRKKAVEWAREQSTGGPTEKAVLLLLAAEMDRRGACRMSTRTIADQADTDPATTSKALERLRSRSLITWETGGGRAPNTYRLHR